MLVVDKNTFKTEVLENEGYVLVDFFGDGCEPCAALMPKVEALGDFELLKEKERSTVWK